MSENYFLLFLKSRLVKESGAVRVMFMPTLIKRAAQRESVMIQI